MMVIVISEFFLFMSNNKDTASKPRLYFAGLPVCQPLLTLNNVGLNLIS